MQSNDNYYSDNSQPTNHENSAFLGLGANLNEPSKQIIQAINAINALEKTTLIAQSSLYRTNPMGPQDQNDFINAVIEIKTALAPEELLNNLQTIEQQHGRVRKAERWGPRTLDIDVLTYAQQVINSARLTVPHYGIKERNFVLIPLFEICPSMVLPCGTSIETLVTEVGYQGIEKL